MERAANSHHNSNPATHRLPNSRLLLEDKVRGGVCAATCRGCGPRSGRHKLGETRRHHSPAGAPLYVCVVPLYACGAPCMPLVRHCMPVCLCCAFVCLCAYGAPLHAPVHLSIRPEYGSASSVLRPSAPVTPRPICGAHACPRVHTAFSALHTSPPATLRATQVLWAHPHLSPTTASAMCPSSHVTLTVLSALLTSAPVKHRPKCHLPICTCPALSQ